MSVSETVINLVLSHSVESQWLDHSVLTVGFPLVEKDTSQWKVLLSTSSRGETFC